MKQKKTHVKQASNKRLTSLAYACDRTGVSDRAAAIIASSVLHDVASTSGASSSRIVDRSKVRRERKRIRKSLQEEKDSENKLISIYFDGRKDNTLIQEKTGNKIYRKTIKEEHITLVREPGSQYLGHIAVNRGSAKAISDGISQALQVNNHIQDNSIIAVGCDGTAVNTGPKGGAIRLLELNLDKPLHWFVCQLHANELPLRHLLDKLDGKTGGPRGFMGEIGKSQEECEKLGVVSFQRVPFDLPPVDKEDLSTDQKYLHDIHQSVSKGTCSTELALRNPGKVVHSRWITTENRVLRLYVAVCSNRIPIRNTKNYC